MTMRTKLKGSIPRTRSEKAAFVSAIKGIAEEMHFSKEAMVMLLECVANSVEHSSGSRISVLLSKDESEIRVCVRDDGTGFDFRRVASSWPPSVDEDHGRGLYIVHAWAKRVLHLDRGRCIAFSVESSDDDAR